MTTNRQKKRMLIPPCPDCGSHFAYRRGSGQVGEQRFTCRRCGRHYCSTSIKKERGPINAHCPGCQGNRLFRRGRGGCGAQKYSCRDCGLNFTPGGGRIDPNLKDIVEKLVKRGLKPGEISEITGCSYYLGWKLRREIQKHENG
jgi:transposase-like protein